MTVSESEAGGSGAFDARGASLFRGYRFDTLTVRQSVCGVRCLRAWRFCSAGFFVPFLRKRLMTCIGNYRAVQVPLGSLLLVLGLCFDLYFSHETFSQSLAHPPDYKQTTAALFAPSELTVALGSTGSNAGDAPLENPPLVRHPTFTPRPSREKVAQSSASKPGTQSNDGAQNLSDSSTNAFQRFFAKLFGKPLPPSSSGSHPLSRMIVS